MADYIPDPPKSDDAQARALLRLNRGRKESSREKSNGSVAIGGKQVGGAISPRGGSQ